MKNAYVMTVEVTLANNEHQLRRERLLADNMMEAVDAGLDALVAFPLPIYRIEIYNAGGSGFDETTIPVGGPLGAPLYPGLGKVLSDAAWKNEKYGGGPEPAQETPCFDPCFDLPGPKHDDLDAEPPV